MSTRKKSGAKAPAKDMTTTTINLPRSYRSFMNWHAGQEGVSRDELFIRYIEELHAKVKAENPNAPGL